jgi:hypothetical protein
MNCAKKKLVRPESKRGLLKNDAIFAEFAESKFITILRLYNAALFVKKDVPGTRESCFHKGRIAEVPYFQGEQDRTDRNESPRGKPQGSLRVVLVGAEARSGAEIYNIVWFNTKSL